MHESSFQGKVDRRVEEEYRVELSVLEIFPTKEM